jgi:uncharacterized protein (UPF0276 family)
MFARLPAEAGVGFKPVHYDAIAASNPKIGFIEVHAENYMGAGGLPHSQLAMLHEHYALSLHGVGLSIGSSAELDHDHLDRVKALCDRYRPESFSEHLAWSSHGGVYFNDLLPLPYNSTTLALVVDHVDQVQMVLGRTILIENPSTYIRFTQETFSEVDFLIELSRRSGCGLLLDVNNVFVSATNHGTDPRVYLDCFPYERVDEIHLAGHDETTDDAGAKLLIDAHGSPVIDPVWTLYAQVIARTGPLPTLIEWDNNVPAWLTLLGEADAASKILADAPRSVAA